MTQVRFYPSVEDSRLRFAVIVAQSGDKWVFCRHKQRQTLECPGGHREPGEPIEDTARRELWEETGAEDFSLEPVCVYAVAQLDDATGQQLGEESCGMLYFARIRRFGPLPELEIGQVCLLDQPPRRLEEWTYPAIQPLLLRRAAGLEQSPAL